MPCVSKLRRSGCCGGCWGCGCCCGGGCGAMCEGDAAGGAVGCSLGKLQTPLLPSCCFASITCTGTHFICMVCKRGSIQSETSVLLCLKIKRYRKSHNNTICCFTATTVTGMTAPWLTVNMQAPGASTQPLGEARNID